MWLDEADGFAEIFKGYLPYYLLVALPIFIIMSPVNPVAASHEFSAYRMQQYDLHTVPHGSRSSSINLEGRSLTTWGTSRHCVVARVQDITIEQLLEIRSKAGALLLVLPKNTTSLTQEEKEHIQLVEMAMTQQEFTAPVYFAHWTPDFEDILTDLQHSFITDDKSGTALEALLNSVSSNGYQIVVSAPSPQKVDSKAVSLHSRLVGSSGSALDIIISAHYDASAIVPDLAFGADSNASGAVAVLELARIFSRLYSMPWSRGGTSLFFLLGSAGPKLNYFSAKKWLDEALDTTEAVPVHDISFAMCLDSISSAPAINMHVSKPPKAGGSAASLQARLAAPVMHKKINLADELLAWPHERFSIRRITAFTLSSMESHKDPARSSILDTPSEQSIQNLIVNIKTIAKALVSHIYNITEEGSGEDWELFEEALTVDEASVRHWYKFLTTQPRSPIAVNAPGTTNIGGVTSALERALSRYLGEVIVTTHAIDKREPEYTLYGPTRATLNVYSVKPAIFDLVLTLGIIAYLTVIWGAIQLFPAFYREYAKLVCRKIKAQ